jgi:hypothetical protein
LSADIVFSNSHATGRIVRFQAFSTITRLLPDLPSRQSNQCIEAFCSVDERRGGGTYRTDFVRMTDFLNDFFSLREPQTPVDLLTCLPHLLWINPLFG